MSARIAMTPAPDMNRSLALAIVVSLLIHGALLVWVPRWEADIAQESPPIVATIESTAVAQPGSAAPAPPQPQSAAPAPEAPSRPERPKPDLPEPKPPKPDVETQPRAALQPERAVPAPREQTQRAPVESPAPAAPRTPGPAANQTAQSRSGADVPEADQAAGALPQPSGPVVEGSAIDAYRAAIYAAAGRYRDYPRYARVREWEGRAVVRLEVDARGRAQRIAIATSSGHDVLDESAVEMVRRAQRDVAVPQALRGRAFNVEVAVVYALED